MDKQSGQSEQGPALVKCPKCNAMLNPKKVGKHLKKVHSKGSTLTSANSKVVGNKAVCGSGPSEKKIVKVKKKYYKCWRCGKLITKASTASHLLNQHGFRVKDPERAHFWYYDEVTKVQYREKTFPTPNPEGAKKAAKTRAYKKFMEELSVLSKKRDAKGKSLKVRCPCCNVDLGSKNLMKHMKNVHPKELVKPVHAPPEKKVEGKPRKILEIKPEYDYSEDVFDRAKVYHGGAYGLGKSRKH